MNRCILFFLIFSFISTSKSETFKITTQDKEKSNSFVISFNYKNDTSFVQIDGIKKNGETINLDDYFIQIKLDGGLTFVDIYNSKEYSNGNFTSYLMLNKFSKGLRKENIEVNTIFKDHNVTDLYLKSNQRGKKWVFFNLNYSEKKQIDSVIKYYSNLAKEPEATANVNDLKIDTVIVEGKTLYRSKIKGNLFFANYSEIAFIKQKNKKPELLFHSEDIILDPKNKIVIQDSSGRSYSFKPKKVLSNIVEFDLDKKKFNKTDIEFINNLNNYDLFFVSDEYGENKLNLSESQLISFKILLIKYLNWN